MGDKKCLEKGETPKPPKDDHQYKCEKCSSTSKKDKKLCKPKAMKK